MAASSGKGKNDGLLDQFIAVTGASHEAGRNMLDACGNNLDMAIGMFMDGGGSEQASTSSASSVAAAVGVDAKPGPSIPQEDDVRAPIPPKQEVLVEENYSFGTGFRGNRRRTPRSVFDGFRDFEAETRQQQEWATRGEVKTKKRKTLEDLFRPPIDLMHKGTFHTARDLGTKTNRWLMVNIQNVQEFCCQALNRDVWSQAAVKSIIGEHFIFWQVYHDSEEGKRYTQFYRINDWPYIAILDPRTGENLAIWNKLDAMTFCDLVTEFLTSHPPLDGITSPPKKKAKTESIVEASEDSQLEAAIQASLAETKMKTSKAKRKESTESSSESGSDLETFSDSEDDTSKEDSKKSSKSEKAKKKIEKSEKKDSEKLETNSEKSGANKTVEKSQEAAISNSGHMTHSSQSDHTNNVDTSSNAMCSNSESKEEKDLDSSTVPRTVDSEVGEETWKQHLGKDTDAQTVLMIRLPNGNREQVKWPCSSTLMALVKFVISKGFSNEQYELVTNFPRRKLSYMDFDDTLKQVGLHPQETVFVQER